jgi:hypothetical protein
MPARDFVTLIHLVGFVTGVVLYAMLGVMTLRSRARTDWIPFVTAILGFIWNTGALVIYTVPGFGPGEADPWLTALAFSSLGFLPAVVVHAGARSVARNQSARALVGGAYALSGSAALLPLRQD